MIGADVEDFLASLLLEKGESENTCVAYRGDLERFVAFLKRRGKDDSASATRDDIVDFLADERSQGMSGATRARRSAAIRMFFRYLKERHRLRANPSDLMDMPRKALSLPCVLTEVVVSWMIDEV